MHECKRLQLHVSSYIEQKLWKVIKEQDKGFTKHWILNTSL